MKRLVILAVLLRVLIMPFFFHPDIKTYNFQSSFLKKGVFNIYNYLSVHKSELPLKEEFVYFPLTYLFLGSYQFVMTLPLGDGFDHWLADASQTFSNNPLIFRYLFILKFPYLILDILVAFVLMKFFDDKSLGKRAAIIWLFNPFTIAIIYFYSNIDIIPVLASLLSLLLLKRKHLIASALLLAIAAGFKVYPLLFLPFLALEIKDFKKSVIYIGLVLSTFLIIIAPFLSAAFANSALVSGLTTRLLIPQVSIGFGESVIIPVVLLSTLFLVAYFNRDKFQISNYVLVLFLFLFSFIHFHIQWLLWMAPFIVMNLVKEKINLLPLTALSITAILIPLFYDDKSMTFSLLRIFSYLYTLIPSTFTIASRFYDSAIIQSVLHSIFVGISLALSYKILTKKE